MEAVTKKPNVPALRFPEFSGEWEEALLGELFSFKNGMTIEGDQYGGHIPFINVSEVLLERPIVESDIEKKVSVSESQVQTFGLREGDFVFQRSSETREEVGSSNFYADKAIAVFGGFVICGRPVREFDSYFVYASLKRPITRYSMSRLSGGSTRYNIGQKSIASVAIRTPSIEEQEKVAAFLTVVDERFGLLKRKKELLEEYKKGVMQRLFSREIRFKDEEGNEYPEWEEKRLGEVLYEHKEKSNGTEQVHSVSVHKGVINQIEHLGRSFAASNTENYNRVYPGDIIYTKSPTGNFPFGIIKRNQKEEEVIVSPLYGVFTAESPGLAIWLDEFFSSEVNTHNYLSSIIQKGAKNTINITNRTFLTNSTLVPVDSNEQDRIGRLFGALNDKIQLVTSEIEALSNFKKGLLQKMFV